MSRLSPHGGGNKFNKVMLEFVPEPVKDSRARVLYRGVMVPSNVASFKYRVQTGI